MKNIRVLTIFAAITVSFLGDFGSSFRNSFARRRKDFSVKDSERVYLGIPLLYQERQEMARELGIDPSITMDNWNGYMSPPQGLNTLKDSPTSFFHSSVIHGPRKKRGIIWNKIQKLKKGFQSVKKKVWKIKEKAISIVKGKDHGTPKPSYPSTGGSWGWIPPRNKPNNQHNNRYEGGPPSLSSSYGPPYEGYKASSSKGYGVSLPISGTSPASSSSNTNYEIYGPPINKEPNYKGLAVRNKYRH